MRSLFSASSSARLPRSAYTDHTGVEFDTIAREWRCKWSDDNDKKSLQEAQKALMGVADDLKGTTGCKSVFRVVCGGNKDFKVSRWIVLQCPCNLHSFVCVIIAKQAVFYFSFCRQVITSVSAADFKLWADAGFPPEASFLEKLGAIDGIHTIETQTYTIMPV